MNQIISNFASILPRRFWVITVASSLALFGYVTIPQYFSGLFAESSIREKVHAAGKLPSFELRRTERLTSDRHDNVPTIRVTLARRSDGAEASVTEYLAVPKGPVTERTVFFPATGQKTTYYDHVRVKSTFYYKHSEPQFVRLQLMKDDPSTRCTSTLDGLKTHDGDVIEELINGIPAVRLNKEDLSLHSRWFAPQLGCIELMTKHDWRETHGGAVASTAHSTLDYIRLAEPSSTLFEDADKYEELRPSVRQDRVDAWYRQHLPNQKLSKRNESYLKGADEAYLSHRIAP